MDRRQLRRPPALDRVPVPGALPFRTRHPSRRRRRGRRTPPAPGPIGQSVVHFGFVAGANAGYTAAPAAPVVPLDPRTPFDAAAAGAGGAARGVGVPLALAGGA